MPTLIEELYETIKKEVDELLAEIAERAGDGIDIPDIWALMKEAVSGLVVIVEAVKATGLDKKKLVLELARAFYRTVVAPLDIPFVPNVIEPYVDEMVGWMIDQIVAYYNREGWPAG